MNTPERLIKPNKVKIVSEGGVAGTKIFIDDEELHNVRAIKFSHEVGGLPQVEVTLIYIGSEVDVTTLSDAYYVREKV